MTDIQRIAIFGAGGATGRQAVRQAVQAGLTVRAVEPDWPDDPGLPDGVEIRTADVMKDDLAPVVEGCDAILSCIGLPLTAKTAVDPPPLYTASAEAYLKAMAATGIRRLVVISASFVATRDRGPWLFRIAATAALEPIFTQMGEMERILRASDTDWTAVRPGWLMAGEATGDYTVTPDVIAPGLIRTRQGDLAHFMLHCLREGEWIRRMPAPARAEARRDESGHRLLAEALGRAPD